MTAEVKRIVITELQPIDRYPTVSGAFEGLKPGEKLELINDHDLQHLLKYKFSIDYPDQYSYEYLEQGPEVWRVLITKK